MQQRNCHGSQEDGCYKYYYLQASQSSLQPVGLKIPISETLQKPEGIATAEIQRPLVAAHTCPHPCIPQTHTHTHTHTHTRTHAHSTSRPASIKHIRPYDQGNLAKVSMRNGNEENGTHLMPPSNPSSSRACCCTWLLLRCCCSLPPEVVDRPAGMQDDIAAPS